MAEEVSTAGEDQQSTFLNEGHEAFSIDSREFRVAKWTLRILSLWHPSRASFCCKYAFPLIVNILLLIMLAADIEIVYRHIKGQDNTVDVYVFLAIDLGTYLNHVLGYLYFRTRDLETNLLRISLQQPYADELKQGLKRLKYFVVISFFLLAVLLLMFYNTDVWLKGKFRCSSVFKFVSVYLNTSVCLLNYPTNLLGTGITLSISWVMYLLYTTSRVRLHQLSRNYLRWSRTAEDAIYDHYTNYSKITQKSCHHLRYWFVIHNLILIIAMPLFIYTIIHSFKNIETKSVDRSLLLCFLIYTSAIWISPLVFAEWLQTSDDELTDEINTFCKGYIEEKLQQQHQATTASTTAASTTASTAASTAASTFKSRADVNKLLSYLKGRKSGFLVGGYSFQFKLSMISFLLGLIAFATKIVDG